MSENLKMFGMCHYNNNPDEYEACEDEKKMEEETSQE